MKNILAMVLMVAFAATTRAAEWPHMLFPGAQQIQRLKATNDWGGLRSECETALSLEGHPVADFSPLPHYDSHGVRPEGKDAPGAVLSRESMAVYRLSECYEISKDVRYSAKAEGLLQGWAETTRHIGTLQGADEFNFNFPYALLGAYALSSDAGWSNKQFDDFVRSVVLPANNAARPNNHGNWGVLLLVTAGAYLHDQSILDKARNRWMELMHSQVAADGSLPLEMCRSDNSNWCGSPTKGIKGIGYTHYALYPTVIAAEILRNLNQSPYQTDAGTLLCKAYARVAYWTLHPDQFPYYASNHGKLEGIYSANYFYILQHRCSVPDGVEVLRKYAAEIPDPLNLNLLYGYDQ